MQLARFAITILFVLLSGAAAKAQTCTLALGTPGTLALSSDATRFGSDELGGVFGTMTILSIGSNIIDVAAPIRTLSPGDYQSGSEVLQVAYTGLGGLSAINQAYTASASSFSVGTIALSTLQIHNRIYNPSGFAAGTYTTRTVVTCR